MNKCLELDPRAGLPSASSMYRIANCPGSLALSNAVKSGGKYYELPDRDAANGITIHKWLELEMGDERDFEKFVLPNEALATARQCADLRDEAITAWAGGDHWIENPDFKLLIERRIFYRELGIARFSGQLDLAVVDREKGRAIILDYKTGRTEAEPAADNLQLRTQAVLLDYAYEHLDEINAAVIEPWISWQSECVRYSGVDLATAEAEILAIVAQTKWKPDKRVPGVWCVHCPGRSSCREARDYIEAIPVPRPENIIAELPRGERGTVLWERIKVAKKLLATLEETYTKILEDEPDALPGYRLPERGRERRLVPFPAKLKAALAEYLSSDEVDGCAEFHLAKIQEVLGFKHRLAGKELERKFNSLVSDAVTVSYDKPFIRPLTKRERENNQLIASRCSNANQKTEITKYLSH